jgi:hypothetical protein
MNVKYLAGLSGYLLLVVTAGCAVIPIPQSETVVAGREIQSEQITLITTGSTNREDVIRELGEPYAEFPDLRIVVYRWEMNRGKVIWFAAGGGYATGGVLPANTPYNLLIAFDPADRVVAVEKMKSPWSWVSPREQALNWAEAQHFTVPKAPSMFVAKEIAPGQSALYVYLEGGFWSNLGLSPLIKPEVRVNGKAVGWLRKGEYLAIALAPGDHTVMLDPIPRQTTKQSWRTVASIDVQTVPGQAGYVAVQVPDRAPPVLTIRSEVEALPALKEMNPMP